MTDRKQNNLLMMGHDRHQFVETIHSPDRLIIEGQDNVSHLESGFADRPFGVDPLNSNALRQRKPVIFGLFNGQWPYHGTQPTLQFRNDCFFSVLQVTHRNPDLLFFTISPNTDRYLLADGRVCHIVAKGGSIVNLPVLISDNDIAFFEPGPIPRPAFLDLRKQSSFWNRQTKRFGKIGCEVLSC